MVVSGPTGAGKSRPALELAKRLNGEIISADSVQVYRGLDVGSAKPSLSDRKEVPHHLVDILHPSQDYSVGQFFEVARQATKDILNNGRVPMVSGGTVLYLRWYIYMGSQMSSKPHHRYHQKSTQSLQNYRNGDWDAAVQLVVKAGDPKAQFLATNDWYRLRRSLEIIKEMMGFWWKLGGFLMRVFFQIQTLQLRLLVIDKQWSTYCGVDNMMVGHLLGTSLLSYRSFRKHPGKGSQLC